MYFLFLILKISLNLDSYVGYKHSRFSKTLSEKGLKFVFRKKGNSIALNLNLVLLLAEVDSVLEKQNCKENTLGFCDTGRIKIVLTLLTEVIALYMETTMVKVGIPSFEGPILGCKICFAIFLAFHKQLKGQFDSFLQVYININIWQTGSGSRNLSGSKNLS